LKPIEIDFRSGVPITTQITQQVEEQVKNGLLRPGDQLPTVRQLAAELRVNFNTVARAYRLLDEAGLISTQQGRGTYLLEALPPNETRPDLRSRGLADLAQQYTAAAFRLGCSPAEIRQALENQLAAENSAEKTSSSAHEKEVKNGKE